MLVFEVFVIEGLAVNLNKLFAEIAVELSIEYIRYRLFSMIVGGAGCSIVQQLDDVFIEEHCLKSWANREVLELHPWFARFVVSRLLTIGEWAMIELLV